MAAFTSAGVPEQHTCSRCFRSSGRSAGASSAVTLSLTFLYLRQQQTERSGPVMLKTHLPKQHQRLAGHGTAIQSPPVCPAWQGWVQAKPHLAEKEQAC